MRHLHSVLSSSILGHSLLFLVHLSHFFFVYYEKLILFRALINEKFWRWKTKSEHHTKRETFFFGWLFAIFRLSSTLFLQIFSRHWVVSLTTGIVCPCLKSCVDTSVPIWSPFKFLWSAEVKILTVSFFTTIKMFKILVISKGGSSRHLPELWNIWHNWWNWLVKVITTA